MKQYYLTANFIQRSAWLPLRLLFVTFAKLEVRGVDNTKKITTNAIIASNHSSELDPLIIVACLPFYSRHLPQIFVSREKAFYSSLGWQKHLYGGFFFSLMGAFQAYTGLNNYGKALTHHLEALTSSKSVCIFPIGKRHSDVDLHQAKGGVMYLATKADLPILPVHITGISEMGWKDFLGRKRKMRVTFGEPLRWQDLAPTEINKLDDDKNEYEQAARQLMKRISGLDIGR